MSATSGSGGPIDEADARALGECLKAGGVAVLPTDTVYGLACDPGQPTAVERLYELKGRPAQRPAAVMFFSVESALRELAQLREREVAAIRALLPGPVTLLLPNRDGQFLLACAQDPSTLGLRVPLLDDRLRALSVLDTPLLQSSANLSGEPAVGRAGDLAHELTAGADLVLDAGELRGTASTVVDLRSYQEQGVWTVLREGALASVDLRRALMLAS